MLAARRKDRVIGRAIFLVVSIRIRAGASQLGVLFGRRRAAVDLGALCKEEIVSISHKGRPNERANIRWLEGLKM